MVAEERATLEDALLAIEGTVGVGLRPRGVQAGETVGGPLPNVARQVVEAKAVRRKNSGRARGPGIRPHRCCGEKTPPARRCTSAAPSVQVHPPRERAWSPAHLVPHIPIPLRWATALLPTSNRLYR